jgi:hypothetical protein
MNEVRIEKNLDEIILYFGTQKKAINAYTLASTLASIADAIKEANLQINPGYDVEVLVTDLGSGSFKAVIKTIYTSVRNLFSKENIKSIILAIIASFLYDHFLSTKPNVIINVTNEYVVVEQGEERVVIHKEVYEASKKIEKQQKFRSKISSTMNTLQNDKDIESFAIINNIEDKPAIEIPRENFKYFIIDGEDNTNEENEKIIEENTTVQITRAILENNSRKWEFVWHGERISAPVFDDVFYKRFYEHRITIAPGDTLDVKLKIYQKKIENMNVFVNKKYEVVNVFEHHKQSPAISERLIK